MKSEKRYKLEGVVAKSSRYPGATHVRLDVEGKRLLATNGHALAIVPCEPEEGDVSGAVTVEALKAARKAGMVETRLACNGALEVPGGASFPRPSPEDAEFPKVDHVVHQGEPVFRVAINAESLAKLAQALGAVDGYVRLEFFGSRVPFRVTTGKEGELGVIMPVTIDGWPKDDGNAVGKAEVVE